MPSDECLLPRRHDEQVVITLPGEAGMTNGPLIREAPLAVGMTAMTLCDSGGRHAVTAACRPAGAPGTGLGAVISARRVSEPGGADTAISAFPDLPAALSG